MHDYEPPERSASGRDVISAWVLYAVSIIAVFAFSTIRESLSTRPPVIVENPAAATDGDNPSNHRTWHPFATANPH